MLGSTALPPTVGIVHLPQITKWPSEMPDHWVFASQLARQTLSVMLTTRSVPARELAKLIYGFADDNILCERRAVDELAAWRLLFQQAVAQVRYDEGLEWDAEIWLGVQP